MRCALVANVPVARLLRKVGVVAGQAGGEHGLGHARAPQREEAVAPVSRDVRIEFHVFELLAFFCVPLPREVDLIHV